MGNYTISYIIYNFLLVFCIFCSCIVYDLYKYSYLLTYYRLMPFSMTLNGT